MAQNMIEIEIINACLSFGGSKDPTKMLNGIDSYCVVKMFGKEIARTEVAMGTFDPIWHEKFPKALHELVSKEVLYNRPFFLESIDIEVYDCSKSVGDKHNKIFETRVPIASIGLFKSYRLLKCGSEGKESHDENRIFVRIGRVSNVVYDKVEHFKFQQLSSVCPVHCPLYRHLYMDFSWSPNAITYNSGLPGPTKGELIVDRYYSVEVRGLLLIHLISAYMRPSLRIVLQRHVLCHFIYPCDDGKNVFDLRCSGEWRPARTYSETSSPSPAPASCWSPICASSSSPTRSTPPRSPGAPRPCP
jgi:hypothetical protein